MRPYVTPLPGAWGSACTKHGGGPVHLGVCWECRAKDPSRGKSVAALYVLADGPYVGLEGVDPWPEERDARTYAGPHPVVAHPPCQRWGRYWFGGPSCKVRKKLGDDDGCFAAAVASVRRWGGVLEHPEASHAWAAHGIAKPPRAGGWVRGDDHGWTCCVEQGHYGHAARKATWLYACGVAREDLPELIWGPSPSRRRLDEGFHSKRERERERRQGAVAWQTRRERAVTPKPFREVLLSIARAASPRGSAP